MASVKEYPTGNSSAGAITSLRRGQIVPWASFGMVPDVAARGTCVFLMGAVGDYSVGSITNGIAVSLRRGQIVPWASVGNASAGVTTVPAAVAKFEGLRRNIGRLMR